MENGECNEVGKVPPSKQPIAANLKIAIWVTLGMVVGALVMSLLVSNHNTDSAEISKESQTAIEATPQAPPQQTSSQISATAANSGLSGRTVEQQLNGDQTAIPSVPAQAFTTQTFPVNESNVEIVETASGHESYLHGPKTMSTDGDPAWSVGENGTISNPCVDPPSTQGRAYSSSKGY